MLAFHFPYVFGEFYLYRCFVRLYFAYGVELLDTSSGLHKPLDDLTFGDTYTQHA